MSEIADGPYPGTRAFRQAEHDHFFGRASDAADIAHLWRANRVTVLYGPVASGKTSLLQAGVYPLMTGPDSNVLPPGSLSYGATFPFAALPAYNSYTLALLRSWLPDEVATRLAGQTVSDFVRGRARWHEGTIFAAIDQAEDLFIDSGSGLRSTWRRRFLGQLARAVRDQPRFHLLLVTRGEALDPIFRAIGNGETYALAPLTRKSALEAVKAPVAGTGRSFTDDAAEKLVLDLRTSPDALIEPALLQILCTRLWQDLPPGIEFITAPEVRAFGDADTALAAHWSQTIAAVAAEHDLTAKRLRSWLLDTFTGKPDTGQPDTGEPVYEVAGTTAGMPNAVVRTLVDRHLLTTGRQAGLRWYQLLSDRLIEPLRIAADERPPAPTPARYLLAAERALALGEFDLAQRYAEQVLGAKPTLRSRAEARSLMGNLAFEREQPGEARKHYLEAASLFEAVRDTDAAAREMAAVGRMLLAQGEAADAVAKLRAAVDRVPNDLAMQTELAVALWHLGKARAAVAILTSVLGIDGGNPEALRVRGEVLADLGDARGAILDLDRQTARDHPSTLAAHGLALAEMGDHLAASREIDDALAKAPRNGLVLLYAARASALAGDDVAAEKRARRAVDATDPPLSPQHRKVAQRLASREQTNYR
jgi:tetratricopeptide (TPR) repeat protein